MTKLNLNALNKININNDSEIIIPEIKQNEIYTEEETQMPNKKKFSLKELNISGTKKQDELQSNIEYPRVETEIKENIDIISTLNIENEKINNNNNNIIDLNDLININIKENIKQDDFQIIEEKSEENKNETSIILESNDTSSKTTTEKILSISDGDTNCNIVSEEKTEIFGNYKGSFTKNDEVEKIVTITKIDELKENTKIENTEIKEIKITPLESYSNNNIINKKNKSKKIIFTSLFVIASLSLSGFLVFGTGLIKSNIQEITKKEEIIKKENNIPNTENVKIEENEIVKEIPENTVDNNIKIGENEIVKENLDNGVDNNINSSKINEKVVNFLTKKYKTK